MPPHIWELKTDNAYVGLTFLDERNFIFPVEARMRTLRQLGPDFAVMFDSRRVKPATVRVPDFVRFSSGSCCFCSAAWKLLEKNLRLRGPTVKLVFNEAGRKLDFVLFEPRPAYDCVSFELSKVQYFDTPPYRVKWIDDLVLRNLPVVKQDIFRIRHMSTRLFCTERCVEFVDTNKLTGFDFQPVHVSS